MSADQPFSTGAYANFSLAAALLELIEKGPKAADGFRFVYPDEAPLLDKIGAIATKVYGAALPRLRVSDFQEVQHAGGISPAWPIDYETLEPYYERAERLYHVRGRDGVGPGCRPLGRVPLQGGLDFRKV